MAEKKNLTIKEKFIIKMKKKFSNKFSLIGEYVDSVTKIEFRCNEHSNTFIQTPQAFIRGDKGCVECSSKRVSKESLMEKFKVHHGDKYDYSKVDFNTTDKIVIGCSVHGDFEMTKYAHAKGQGCPKCMVRRKKSTTEKFIEKAILKNGDSNTYENVVYIDSVTPVNITCKIHGPYMKVPAKHLQGQGCQVCSKESTKKKITFTQEEVIERFVDVHGNKYGYEDVRYINMLTKVNIMCCDHGVFEQIPADHLRGHGCLKCTSSVSKEENNFFDELALEGVVRSSTKWIYPMQLDGYLKAHNLGIEYCGLYFHTSEFVGKDYHLNKKKACDEKGIRLIQVFSDEWFLKKDIVKSRINSIIGVYSRKIHGRKTHVKYIEWKEASEFLIENHLQGSVQSSINVGLYKDDELLSLMCFNRPRKGIGGSAYDFEMSRYCVKKDVLVVGGANKLMKFFENDHKDVSVVTYADLRWSVGDVYPKLGFNEVNRTKPNYSYVVGKKREFRFKYRKRELIKEGFDGNKTEEQIMKERGIMKIYDCGVITFVKNI